MMRKLFPILPMLFVCICLSGQSVSEHRERKSRLEREIEILDKQLAANAKEKNSKLNELELVRRKVANRKALLAETDAEIRRYNDDIYLTQRKINSIQARIDTLSEHYSRLVLSAYKNRDARLWYMYMLASDNIGQALRRMGYFRNLSGQINSEAKQIQQMKKELEEEKEKISSLKKDAQKVRLARAAELEKLRKEEAVSNSVVRQLSKERQRYEVQLSKKKKEVLALNKELARLVELAMKEKDGKNTKSDPAAVKLSAEFSSNKGKLPWPADGPVVDHFGQRFHPVYKNLKLPPKNGIEIALDKDTPVKAVFDGVVKQIMVQPGYNMCIIVRHGDYFSFYCRLKSTSVKVGDKVKVGQTIGIVDTMNGQTRLHFEVWSGSKPQNPMLWLR